ncbi:cytidine deaminase [Actinoplanes sp. RD1]|uniref:cytidine deaminase n=1 Tax=Actinoplanes sp. RD1 TaxID=3064538 RepID=UPI00274052B3|nr:cytidine deaminase [Actinoplanes sp. RD1]
MPEKTIPNAGATELGAEDAKLVTLARGARARVGAAEGASVRDQDGRTYAAATVALPSLQVTALQLAVASAVAAGAQSLEAAAVATAAETLDGAGHAAVRDLGAAAPIHVVGVDGELRGTVTE